MKFNPKKQIESEDALADYIIELFECSVESIKDDRRFIRDADEDDNPDFVFIWTDRGANLIERFRTRLYKIADKYIPDYGIEIESNFFIEN